MNDPQRPDEPLFDGLEPLGPPADLRRQVLDRATAALCDEPPEDLWARIWNSRPLRLAWATAVLALAGANLAITRGPDPTSTLVASFAHSLAEVDEEVAEIVRLPRLQIDPPSLAAVLMQSASAEATPGSAAPALPFQKEKTS